MAMNEMALASQIGLRAIIKMTAQAIIMVGQITKSALLYPSIVLSKRANPSAINMAASAWNAPGKRESRK